MGLTMSDNNGIYLSTFDGYFEQKLKEPKPGSIQRVNKNNETINVMRFNTLVGKLSKIEYKHTEKYGDFWSLTIVDDQTYKLDLSVTSSSTFYFLNRLINSEVDLKAPIELKVFAEVEDDKKKTVILLKQGGKMINGVYTKDNPQDLPAMKQIMFKGKLEWDSTERDAYIRNIVETYVAPELDGHTPTAEPEVEADMNDVELPEWAKPENEPPSKGFSPPPPAAKPATPPAAEKETKAPAKPRGAK